MAVTTEAKNVQSIRCIMANSISPAEMLQYYYSVTEYNKNVDLAADCHSVRLTEIFFTPFKFVSVAIAQ